MDTVDSPVGQLVTAQHLLGDRGLVYLCRTVGEGEYQAASQHPYQQ